MTSSGSSPDPEALFNFITNLVQKNKGFGKLLDLMHPGQTIDIIVAGWSNFIQSRIIHTLSAAEIATLSTNLREHLLHLKTRAADAPKFAIRTFERRFLRGQYLQSVSLACGQIKQICLAQCTIGPV